MKWYGRTNCAICDILPPQRDIQNKSNGNTFRLYCGLHADCCSKNVVYCISCTLCGMQYVGETTNLRMRINNHKSCVRLGRMPQDCSRLYQHFTLSGHSHKTMRITILHHVPAHQLLQAETRWIGRLETIWSAGINVLHQDHCATL